MDNLKDILEKEIEIYKQERELVKRKISAIESDNIPIIEEITKQEELFISVLEQLEIKRKAFLKTLNFETITQYVQSLNDEKRKEEILNIKSELVAVLNDIQFSNKTAEQLVNISAGILNNVIRSATGNKEIGYKKNRQKKEITQNNLLNKKI